MSGNTSAEPCHVNQLAWEKPRPNSAVQFSTQCVENLFSILAASPSGCPAGCVARRASKASPNPESTARPLRARLQDHFPHGGQQAAGTDSGDGQFSG